MLKLEKLRVKKSTPGNEVKRLLLEVELGLGKVAGGRPNKIKARLGIVDRSWPRGRSDKVQSGLGIVDWGWSRGRCNKVEGRLGKVERGGSRGGGEIQVR